MAEDPEKQAETAPDEAPAAESRAAESETSAAADSSQGASSGAARTAEDEAATPPHGDELADAVADADEGAEEAASAADPATEEPEAAPSTDSPQGSSAEGAPSAAETPAKTSRPKRADRAASTPRRQRGGERRRGEREPGEPAPVVRAQAKYVRSSARKARLVCDHIRGKSVVEARAILAVTPRAIARDWSKLLESAVANAEHNHELVGEDLVVKAVHADEGPTIKRFRPRAMGRATQIRKRTSHLTILLTPKD
jgi:ribosomal protein L22